MQHIKAHKRQSLLDIAIQESGGLDNLFEWVEMNERSATDDVLVNEVLTVPDNPVNWRIKQHYDVNSIKPATGISGLGIGYYQIPTII